MRTTISELWRLYGGPAVCARSTFSAIVNGTYTSMDSNLVQDIFAFVDGFNNPGKCDF